jgi:RNA polymerase sigma factor (sigma-70 family)
LEKNSTYKRLRKRLQAYIERYPPPTASENTENFKILRELEEKGHLEEAKRVRDRIIISNGAFGMKYAIKYSKLVHDKDIIEDLFQQAQIGLIEVTDKFDPYLGYNFTTYAWHYVRKCIVDYIKKNKLVPASRDVAKNLKVVTKILDQLYTNTKGSVIHAKEVKELLEEQENIFIEERVAQDILILIDLNSTSTKDTFIVGGVSEISNEENNQEMNMLLKSLLLKDVSEMNRELVEIIKMRFGIDCKRPFSLSEIRMLKKLSEDDIERYKEETRAFLNIK